MADAGLEGRPVEERRREDVQGVEPAAGLADVFDDEVAREVVLEPFGVVEGIVHLGETHGAGVEPDVEDILDTAHRRGAGGVVGIGPGQLVDEGPVQVRLALFVARQDAEVGLQLGEGAIDVEAWVLRVVGAPDGNRTAPEAIPADRPVAGVLQPLAELAVLDVVGRPGDLLVQLEHPVLEFRHLDEPGRDGHIEQRLLAAPAVRVGVLVGLAAQQHRALGHRSRIGLSPSVVGARAIEEGARLEVLGDDRVGVEDVQALIVGDREDEGPVGADGHDGLNADPIQRRLVVLTEAGRHVDDAGAVLGRDEVGRDDLVGVRVALVIGEGRLVGRADQLRSLEPGHDSRTRVLAGGDRRLVLAGP